MKGSFVDFTDFQFERDTSDPSILHMNGVPWYRATPPDHPHHDHAVQTIRTEPATEIRAETYTYWCACGAMRWAGQNWQEPRHYRLALPAHRHVRLVELYAWAIVSMLASVTTLVAVVRGLGGMTLPLVSLLVALLAAVAFRITWRVWHRQVAREVAYLRRREQEETST